MREITHPTARLSMDEPIFIGVGMTKQPSISEGTFGFTYSFFNGPPEKIRLATRLTLEDGKIEVLTKEDQIALELVSINKGEEALLDQWISPHLFRSLGQAFTIMATWKSGLFVDFAIDSTNLLRNSESQSLNLSRKSEQVLMQDMKFPSAHSSIVAKKSYANAARIRQLRQMTERLLSALGKLSSGMIGAVLDISVILRAMITTRSPLLVDAAREVGYNLVVFVPAPMANTGHFSALQGIDASAIAAVATAIPTQPNCIDVRLEEWLDWPALLVDGEVLPHWRLIYNVGGKFGAHGDIDAIDQLEVFLNQNLAGVDLGILSSIFKQYGELIAALAQRFLHSFDVAN